MLSLYYAPGSSALAAHLALEEAGADYAAVRISLADDDQRGAEYLALNPKGRVPALVTERGVLTENPAILAYVAQSYPQARLAPLDDPFAFAQMQQFNAYLASTVHVAFAHLRRGARWADEPAAIAEMARKAPEAAAAALALIEDELPTHGWVLGRTYSVADGYLFTIAGWIERDGLDPAEFPNIVAHRARVGARPATRKVLAEQAAQ